MAIPFVILRWLVLFLLSWIGHGAGSWGDTLTFSSLVWFYDWGGQGVVPSLAFCSGHMVSGFPWGGLDFWMSFSHHLTSAWESFLCSFFE